MMIKLNIVGGEPITVEEGVTLEQVARSLSFERQPVAAIVNGNIQELDYPLYIDSEVKWVDYNCNLGWRTYTRSLIFLMRMVIGERFPDLKLMVSHSLSQGMFCWLIGPEGRINDPARVATIEKHMKEYVEANLRLKKTAVSREDAAAYFASIGQPGKASLVLRRPEQTITMYQAQGYRDYYFGIMATSLSCLEEFELEPFDDGFVLYLPARQYLGREKKLDYLPMQLQATMAEFNDWSTLMGIRTVDQLNEIVERPGDDFTDLILIAETLQERYLHDISDAIYADFPKVRLVLLAGPSSSGKTSTCRRLGIQFRTLGVHPVQISMDDYYVDREKTPLGPDGQPDYECVEALDVELFQKNMRELLEGKEASLPRYDFKAGRSIKDHRRLRLANDQILIVEGIHALNPRLSDSIPKEQKRCIFISALTQLNLDDYNPLSASDNRLIRRMVRDMQFRNLSPSNTLALWDKVRRGENIHIYPHHENADFFINSVLIYELPVLRPLAEGPLSEIGPEDPNYLEAQRVLKLIRLFSPAPSDAVPRSSILQEFLGHSLFDV